METLYFLGIDISKKKLDAAMTLDGVTMYDLQADNNPTSIKGLFDELRKKFAFGKSQLIVCMEHTGIYGQPVLDYLVSHKIRVCLEPAIQIKRSQGITRGKNDKVDARRIASFAYKNQQTIRFWKPQRCAVQKLKALLVTRERLLKAKVRLEVPIRECKEFIEASIRKAMVKHCQKSIKALTQNIISIEKEIDLLIKEDEPLSEQMRWASSVPGIGKITAASVIVATGEFKMIHENKKFACHAGIAPFEYSSGSSIRGKTRVSKMANMALKTLLHLSAMSAIRHCDELRAFYQRKVAEGKNKMSVINAVRNKLTSRIFACVKNKRVYEKNYLHALA